MYICLCKAVSEKRIRAAVAEGACTMRDLTRELRVGSVCGKCVPAARVALAESLAAHSQASSACGSAGSNCESLTIPVESTYQSVS